MTDPRVPDRTDQDRHDQDQRDHAGATLAGESAIPHLTGAAGEVPPAAEEVIATEGATYEDDRQQSDTKMSAWLVRADHTLIPVALDALPSLLADEGQFVWVDLSSYTEQDLRRVAGILHLHPGAIHAALAAWHRPHLAVYPDHFFLSVTVAVPEPAHHRVEARELDLFVGRSFLVSAHKQPLPFAEHLRRRVEASGTLVTTDTVGMLYLVLDETLAYYEEVNRHLQAEIERLEERALRDTSEDFLEHLVVFKRYAFAVLQLAEPHRAVFAALIRPDFLWVATTEAAEYFRDVESRLARLLDLLTGAREAVNGAFDIYLSHVTHRTNQVIKVLTMVSTIILPATLIVALFGANVATSIRGYPASSPVGFLVMLLCIVVVTGSIVWAFRRRGWL